MQAVNSYLPRGVVRGVDIRMEDDRIIIQRYMKQRDIKAAGLSKAIGKSHAYIQQYLKRGIPAELHPKVRDRIADALGIDEWLNDEISSRNRLTHDENITHPKDVENIAIAEHDVRVSAGNGAMIDEETTIGEWGFPVPYVRNALGLRTTELSIVEVIGDSMEPTLRSGDRIMVDLADRNVSQPGVFAMFDGDATVVKRLEKMPGTNPPKILIISDNPRHRAYEVEAEMVHIAGRVVWYGRRL